jgi:hypothetical protein
MRYFKEPLLHFLIIGGVLFLLYGWLNPDAEEAGADPSRTVHITAAEIDWLKQTWMRQRQRPPSEPEFRGVVGEYILEVLLAREAIALGLDENDTVVQRRLAQKMAFIVENTAQLAEPDDETLHRFHQTHSGLFQAPARVSFSHIYFNPDRRGTATEADAREALQQLQAVSTGTDPAQFGDRFLGAYDLSDAEEAELNLTFGEKFARDVFSLVPGEWQGPIPSGFGFHLVRVTKAEKARLRDFEAVGDKVLARWHQQQAEKGREQYFASLLSRYELVLDDSVRALVGPLDGFRRLIK